MWAELPNVPTPKVKGTAKVGKTLKIVVKASRPKPTSILYQWYANGQYIKRATKSTLKIGKALRGKKLTVTVASSRDHYNSVTKIVKVKGTVKGAVKK